MFYVVLNNQWSIKKYLFALCWAHFMFQPIFVYISIIPIKTFTLVQNIYVYLIHVFSICSGCTSFKWNFFFTHNLGADEVSSEILGDAVAMNVELTGELSESGGMAGWAFYLLYKQLVRKKFLQDT